MQSSKDVLLSNSSLVSISPKSLSNEALIRKTQTLVAEERRLTTEILWHLHEIQVRKLFAERGYSSLFEYAVQVLGYSEAAAGRRIAAMKLLVEVPEIEPALKQGSVNLSTLSTIQSFIQRKVVPVTKQEKKELVFALQGKSKRECERELAQIDPEAAIPKERERVVGPAHTEIRFVADDALMEKLKRIRELDAHVTSGASYLELFHRIADVALNELDPLAKDSADQKASSAKMKRTGQKEYIERERVQKVTPPAELEVDKKKVSHPRFIPAALKRAVWRRDKSQCCYVGKDGRRCTSKFGLQIDHEVPVALGGEATYSNLRLLCRAHNQYEAFRKLGPSIYSGSIS